MHCAGAVVLARDKYQEGKGWQVTEVLWVLWVLRVLCGEQESRLSTAAVKVKTRRSWMGSDELGSGVREFGSGVGAWRAREGQGDNSDVKHIKNAWLC